ncbi:peroxiredoxin [Methylocystis parvus]|uniref:thioredoxin-dependent peroxiredoxin n=1 Tax=Methylocystis parvus TaxID=134 RepID=A0A6B8M6Z0_9HYPH|nr:peroxiredoxin [Methylocystis parvus]QGM97782.1 peroxiredoxin [Methylocystis parvus]WBK01913.1 peroxiredoxin [Methylocystis parvus OBBP]
MKTIFTLMLVSLGLFAGPANAALKPGDIAPLFSAQAALGGKDFDFSLAEALKKGPVVLYFYPKSFTKGCTIEAHEFAESYDNFALAGASLIGVSYDPIDIQREFSTKECRDKFPVAADPNLSVISAYDAKRLKPSANGDTVADRISYVILPDGKVGYALTDSNPSRHVEETLAFVRKWRELKKTETRN